MYQVLFLRTERGLRSHVSFIPKKFKAILELMRTHLCTNKFDTNHNGLLELIYYDIDFDSCFFSMYVQIYLEMYFGFLYYS